MVISDDRLNEFIALCERYFGFTPTREEAEEMATSLLELTSSVITNNAN